jgi:hypothetical protein
VIEHWLLRELSIDFKTNFSYSWNLSCSRFWDHFGVTEWVWCLTYGFGSFLCSFLCTCATWNIPKHIDVYLFSTCIPKISAIAFTFHWAKLSSIRGKFSKMTEFQTTHHPIFLKPRVSTSLKVYINKKLPFVV